MGTCTERWKGEREGVRKENGKRTLVERKRERERLRGSVRERDYAPRVRRKAARQLSDRSRSALDERQERSDRHQRKAALHSPDPAPRPLAMTAMRPTPSHLAPLAAPPLSPLRSSPPSPPARAPPAAPGRRSRVAPAIGARGRPRVASAVATRTRALGAVPTAAGRTRRAAALLGSLARGAWPLRVAHGARSPRWWRSEEGQSERFRRPRARSSERATASSNGSYENKGLPRQRLECSRDRSRLVAGTKRTAATAAEPRARDWERQAAPEGPPVRLASRPSSPLPSCPPSPSAGAARSAPLHANGAVTSEGRARARAFAISLAARAWLQPLRAAYVRARRVVFFLGVCAAQRAIRPGHRSPGAPRPWPPR